jgi:hypothetical protein
VASDGKTGLRSFMIDSFEGGELSPGGGFPGYRGTTAKARADEA